MRHLISVLFLVVGLVGCTAAEPPPTELMPLTVQGTDLVDPEGNPVVLRGINVGGGAKLPSKPSARTHEAGFLASGAISFVDRPFPLAEAAEHFERIASWGFNFVRLLTSWEAIAHAGPGIVDEAYLDYFDGLVQAAADAGLYVLVDMHQDVWSRWTGGDGAPRWTLEAVGFDVDLLHETGAARLHSRSDAYPFMLWPTNNTKLAAATMFTLLFAGDTYAPDLRVDAESAQQFLQREYSDAWVALAAKIGHHRNIVGYDLMNEPGAGYIGLADLDEDWDSLLTNGPMPTPAQSMFVAQVSQAVPEYEFGGFGFDKIATRNINPDSQSVWQDGSADIWQQAGVWELQSGKPVLLKSNHFAGANLVQDFLTPFYQDLARAIQQADPDATVFLETPLFQEEGMQWPVDTGVPAVFAPHWYDGLSLISRDFTPDFNADTRDGIIPVFGEEDVQALFEDQLAELKHLGHEAGLPVVIGEFGLPFDPDEEGFASRIQALQMYYKAMDANGLSSALWNYNPENEAEFGDGWNREDFSVISREHPEGRALEGFIRP